MHVFGSTVYSHIPKEHRNNKFADKAKKLRFMVYSEESKAYRLLEINKGRIKISRDVIFLKEEILTEKS